MGRFLFLESNFNCALELYLTCYLYRECKALALEEDIQSKLEKLADIQSKLAQLADIQSKLTKSANIQSKLADIRSKLADIQSKFEKLAAPKPQSRFKKLWTSRRWELVIFSWELLPRIPMLQSIQTIMCLLSKPPSPCIQRPIQRLTLSRKASGRLIRGSKRKSDDADVLQRSFGKVMRLTCAEGPWYKTKPLGYSKWLIEDLDCDKGTHVIRNRSETDEGARGWDSLPHDLQGCVLEKLDFKDLFRFKLLSKASKQYIESDDFRRRRAGISEGSFTAFSYYIKNKAWQCSAYDLDTKSWRAFPTLSSNLPTPDPELFKEFSVTGHGGFMCAEVSKLPKKGELVVFNPLTGEQRALPPLLHPRVPVLVHLAVNSSNHSFKVIVAGSSSASDEHLSRKMEVFDSVTSEWTEACDVLGPAFALNEHQGGVCVDGTLFLIAFLESGGRGVLAFEVETGKWVRTCPIENSCCCNTLQLVENGGKVYLFSERERGASVEHRIDELELLEWEWKKVVRAKKSGGRGLLVYPEQTCVGFGDRKLCIFNALNRDGVVYDTQNGEQCAVLEPPPPDQKGDNFFSLNPALFSLQPNFATKLS